MKRPVVYECRCGKRFDSLLAWSNHYRDLMPKVKSHQELGTSELREHITRGLAKHNDHHRLTK